MATQPYVAGPSGVFAHIGGGPLARRPVLLGIPEDSAQVSINRQWEPLWNALGGSKIPSDRAYQGEDALVRVALTRWSEPVYAAISCAHSPYGNGVRGTDPFGALGTLSATEGAGFPLTLRLPYASTKRSFTTMPPAYRFLSAVLDGPDDLGPLSTKPRKLSLVFYCQRIFDARTLTWKLYDHVIAGLPNFS